MVEHLQCWSDSPRRRLERHVAAMLGCQAMHRGVLAVMAEYLGRGRWLGHYVTAQGIVGLLVQLLLGFMQPN